MLGMRKGEWPHRKQCNRFDVPWEAHALTFSCFRRRPFLVGKRSPAWLLESLDAARNKGLFDLWAYVIMPEHVHLVLLPAEGIQISVILQAIKLSVARRAVAWVRANKPLFLTQMADVQPSGKTAYRFWQRGGGYDRNLWTASEIHEKIRYIHNNPLRRGLANRVDDWPWSSWRAWEEGIDEPIRIDRGSVPMLVS
jgi:putative transposase